MADGRGGRVGAPGGEGGGRGCAFWCTRCTWEGCAKDGSKLVACGCVAGALLLPPPPPPSPRAAPATAGPWYTRERSAGLALAAAVTRARPAVLPPPLTLPSPPALSPPPPPHAWDPAFCLHAEFVLVLRQVGCSLSESGASEIVAAFSPGRPGFIDCAQLRKALRAAIGH